MSNLRDYLTHNYHRVILTILITVSAILLFKPGFPLGHDTYAHATYTKLFFNTITTDGQIPVRWVEHIWIGYGQPLFNHYQVGFFYLTSFVHLFTTITLLSIKIVIFILWWIGGYAIYKLTAGLGKKASLIATTVYISSPYLLLDIFIRTSFPEFSALSLAPLIIYLIKQTINNASMKYATLLGSVAAIMAISHLPTVVIFLPIFAVYTIVKLKKSGITSNKLMLCGYAVLISAGLSAFYTLPALIEMNTIQLDKLQTGQFNVTENFSDPTSIFTYIWGYNGEWFAKNTLFQYLIIIPTALIIITSLYALTKNRQFRSKAPVIPWLITLLFVYILITPSSYILWDNAQFLSFLQFPWRYAMIIPLTTSVLAAYIVNSTNPNFRLTILLAILIPSSTLPVFGFAPFENINYFNLPMDQFKSHPEANYVSFHEPAYSPAKTEDFPAKQQFSTIVSSNKNAKIQIIQSKITNYQFQISSDEPHTITLHTPKHPSWNAYLNRATNAITSSQPYNFISTNIPAGSHSLEFKYTPTNLAQISTQITSTTLIIALVTLFTTLIRSKSRQS